MGILKALRPSTDIANNASAMRNRLKRDGYLYFPGYLDRDALINLRREMMETVARYGWIAEGTNPVDGIPSHPPRYPHMEEKGDIKQFDSKRGETSPVRCDAHEDSEIEGWRDGYIAIQRLESFHRQAHDPRILRLISLLFDDDDILVHGQRIARAVWPSQEQITTPPHQDFTHIQGTADVITAWIPLSDCPRELGGLRYLLKSHASQRIWEYDSTPAGPRLKDIKDDDPAWATADWRLGDLVLHHSFTVHSALPNTSQRLRVSMDYRYQRAKDPVAIESLKPHNCPYVPDWPELLDGVPWSSFEWVNRVRRHPDTFNVTAMTREYFVPVEEQQNSADYQPLSRLLRTD